MKFEISNVLVNKLLLDYLKKEKLWETLCAFLIDTNSSFLELDCFDYTNNINLTVDDMKYIQKIILQGRWHDTEIILKKLIKSVHSKMYDQIHCIILKAKYLEEISFHGGGGRKQIQDAWRTGSHTKNNIQANNEEILDIDNLVIMLEQLQSSCEVDEFDSLYQCLSADKITDVCGFENWCVSKGRIDAFEDIHSYLMNSNKNYTNNIVKSKYSQVNDANADDINGTKCSGLLAMIGYSLQFQLENHTDIKKHFNSNVSKLVVDTSWYNDINVIVPSTIIEADSMRGNKVSLQSCNYCNNSNSNYQNPSVNIVKNSLLAKTSKPNLVKSTANSRSYYENANSDVVTSTISKPYTQDNTKIITHSQQNNIIPLGVINKTNKMISKPSQWLHQILLSCDSPLRSCCVLDYDYNTSSANYHDSLNRPAHSMKKRNYIALIGSNARSLHSLQLISHLPNMTQVPNIDNAECNTMKINNLNEYKNIHKGSLYAIAYTFITSDNDDECQVLVATGSNDKTIQLLTFNFKKDERNDSMELQLIKTQMLKGHNGTIRDVAFQPAIFTSNIHSEVESTKLLLSGGAGDCCVKLWDVYSGSLIRSFEPPHHGAIHSLCWCSNTSFLSTCDAGTVMLNTLDMDTPLKMFNINNKLSEYIRNNHLHNNQSVLDKLKEIIHVDKQKLGIFSVCVVNNSADEMLIALGCSQGYLIIFDISSDRILTVEKCHEDDIRAMCLTLVTNGNEKRSINNDNNVKPLLVTGSDDHTLIVWELVMIYDFSQNSHTQLVQIQLKSWGKLLGHTDKILSCTAISSSCTTNTESSHINGMGFVTTSADGTSRFWSPSQI